MVLINDHSHGFISVFNRKATGFQKSKNMASDQKTKRYAYMEAQRAKPQTNIELIEYFKVSGDDCPRSW